MNTTNGTDWKTETTANLAQEYARLDRALYEVWESQEEKNKAQNDFYMISIELKARRVI